MERLTNDKTAAELKENIDKLAAVGIEVDPECGYVLFTATDNSCAKCGAKMDGGENDETDVRGDVKAPQDAR